MAVSQKNPLCLGSYPNLFRVLLLFLYFSCYVYHAQKS
nr:MAG TPA: hypothetical protein [Caudoviricetes sp.]DAX31549.1 MAG TPA: hypothetical protein [Caudoviricetes sp.]